MRARVFDRADAGFEGPWATTARMLTLRSVKELAGPALGQRNLTFRAWFEAQFGRTAWDALDKIPRLQWMDYLRWFRHALALDVANRHELTDLAPRADGVVALTLHDASTGATNTVLARHVVLATGRDGLGGAWVPDWAAQLPRERWLHSSHAWQGSDLAGKRIAVIGGSASAMDAAATALEGGAARVDLLVRRPVLPLVAKGRGAYNPGLIHGFGALPDDWKWRYRHFLNVEQIPPPRGSSLRVSRHANAHFHFGVPVHTAAVRADGALRLDTPKGPLAADLVIFATGFRNHWEGRPELARIAPHVRLWADRFTAPDGQADGELAESPDLGALYEFQPRTPGACPGLERVHCFNYAATATHGLTSGDIPQISEGAQKLARGLAAQFLAEDAAHHFEAMQRWDQPELEGDEWVAAEFPAYEDDAAEVSA